MRKVNSKYYIHDVDPEDEETLYPAKWYTKEQFKMNVINGDTDNLNWHLAQGWVPDAGSPVSSQDESEPPIITDVYTLVRRAINPEEAIKDIIDSYTKGYNEGRYLNDLRYDDIVNLYTAMQDNTEDDLNDMEDDSGNYDGFIEAIIADMETDNTLYTATVKGDMDAYGDSMRTSIATIFNNKISALRQDLVSRGMYNSTIWASSSTGIERERAIALTDLEDKIILQQLNLEHTIYNKKLEMRKAFLDAYDRMKRNLIASTESKLLLRNNIIKGLADFMERRTDAYPDMGDIGKLAEKLGSAIPAVPGIGNAAPASTSE